MSPLLHWQVRALNRLPPLQRLLCRPLPRFHCINGMHQLSDRIFRGNDRLRQLHWKLCCRQVLLRRFRLPVGLHRLCPRHVLGPSALTLRELPDGKVPRLRGPNYLHRLRRGHLFDIYRCTGISSLHKLQRRYLFVPNRGLLSVFLLWCRAIPFHDRRDVLSRHL